MQGLVYRDEAESFWGEVKIKGLKAAVWWKQDDRRLKRLTRDCAMLAGLVKSDPKKAVDAQQRASTTTTASSYRSVRMAPPEARVFPPL
jgi:hypothetical protein